MRKQFGLALLLCFGILLKASPAAAHFRNYVWTQEYKTLPKNTFEIEGHTTLKVPDGNQTNKNTWQYQGELEYGITDHWNIAHYQRWKTHNRVGPDDSTVYEGFKFETKYRIGEKGKFWLDPLLYLEWATDVRAQHRANEFEGILVLSKDWQKFNVSYNQILESEIDRGGRTEHKFSVGTNYEFWPDVYGGAEFAGDYWAPGSHRNGISLGPTVSWENSYFWIACGALFGLNHEANDKEARVIVGVPF